MPLNATSRRFSSGAGGFGYTPSHSASASSLGSGSATSRSPYSLSSTGLLMGSTGTSSGGYGGRSGYGSGAASSSGSTGYGHHRMGPPGSSMYGSGAGRRIGSVPSLTSTTMMAPKKKTGAALSLGASLAMACSSGRKSGAVGLSPALSSSSSALPAHTSRSRQRPTSMAIGPGSIGSGPVGGAISRRPRSRSVHHLTSTTSPASSGYHHHHHHTSLTPQPPRRRSPSLSGSLSSLSGKSSYSSGYGSNSTLAAGVAHNDDHSSKASPVPTSASVENGVVDYKKLYEEAMVDNERLRQRLVAMETEFREAKQQSDKSVQMANSRVAAVESDKRENRALERKLAEMEEELKMMEELRTENRRLRDENGALIRVISKLSK